MDWTDLRIEDEASHAHMDAIARQCSKQQWPAMSRALDVIADDTRDCLNVRLDESTGDLFPAEELRHRIAERTSRHTKHLHTLVSDQTSGPAEEASALTMAAWKHCGAALYQDLLAVTKHAMIIPDSVKPLNGMLAGIKHFIEHRPESLQIHLGSEDNDSLATLVANAARWVASQMMTLLINSKQFRQKLSEEMESAIPLAIQNLEIALEILQALHAEEHVLRSVYSSLTNLKGVSPD